MASMTRSMATMPWGPPKPRNAVLETVCASCSGATAMVRVVQEIAVVGMEHGAVADGGGEVRRHAAACRLQDSRCPDAALLVEADIVVDDGSRGACRSSPCRRRGRAGPWPARPRAAARRVKAAMAAMSAGWLSLPPKPPPMRRSSTVTAWSATPSTLATLCCTSLGCCVEEWTWTSASSPGSRTAMEIWPSR